MRENDNNFQVYSYCKILNTKKWDEFIKNLLNEKAKQDFLDKMTKRSKYAIGTIRRRERNQN